MIKDSIRGKNNQETMSLKTLLLILLVVVLIVAGTLTYVFVFLHGYSVTSPPRYRMALYQTVVESGWILTVDSLPFNTSPSDIRYYLLSGGNDTMPGTMLENGTLASINAAPSGYNITWVDKDSNGLLSLFDVIFIANAGGSSGRAHSGDQFTLRKNGENAVTVYLK